ncbi:MAG: response regulator [Halobacteria archaeon]|nr:response regulator [Halobacteria archaeon]
MGFLSKILDSVSGGENEEVDVEDKESRKSPEDTTILVVDDENQVADLYSKWLELKDYSVRTAYGGEEALEKMDDEVDIVFLDRRMPVMSGDEVLEKINERGYSCQVAMLTAVDPDFDIVDMEFDHYITKPVDKGDLEEATQDLLERTRLDDETQERQTMELKKSILQDEANDKELEESDEFQSLSDQLNQLDRSETENEEIDDFFS